MNGVTRLPKKALIAIASLSLLLTGCGTSVSNTINNTVPANKTTIATNTSGRLVVGYEAEATSLDPAQITDINSGQVVVNMYDTLVRWSPTHAGTLVADLATHWAHNKAATTYTFTLRSNAKFSDGTPVTASSVVFSFQRILDPKNPYYKYGPFPFASFFFGNIQSVQAISAHKVEFKLKKPEASFVQSLSVDTAAIVNPNAVKKYGKAFAQHGGGSGPFMLVSWKKGVSLTLKPNPYYWGPKAKLKQLVFIPITASATRSSDLQSGAVNLVINPNPNALASLKKQGFKTSAVPGPHIWYIGLNLKQKPFNNLLVREALNYAINRKAITQGILYNTGLPADQPLAPMQLGYNHHVNHYHYNPTKAKALLAKAGYPHGFTTTLLVPTSGSGMQNPKSMGTAIQGYLQAIGVTVKIKEMDWGTFLNTVHAGAVKSHLGMWELSWMDSAVDPSLILGPLLSTSSLPPGPNHGFYSNPKVDHLLQQAESTASVSKRAGFYKQIEAIVNRDAPWIFVDHADQIVAYSKTVHGFALNKTFPFLLNFATVSVS